MALQKQNVQINFAQGLDTKTDPKQVQLGKFLELEDTVFNKGGKLQKRNGFRELPSLPDDSSTFVTTFNGNLTAIGSKLSAFSAGSQTWVEKGHIQPAKLKTLPLIRSNTNQTQADSAVSPSGLICTVFTDSVPDGSSPVLVYKYAIADVATGQNIIAPTEIPVASGTISGSPRVFVLGNYFVIVITNVITGTPTLQYVAVNLTDPTDVSANTTISAQYTPADSVAFDGVVANNTLFLAWNGSDVGGAIRMRRISATLTQSAVVTFAGRVATVMSVTADTTGPTPVIWAAFYDAAGDTAYALAVNQILNTVLAPTQFSTVTPIKNIAAVAQNSVCTILYELENFYAYDTDIPTNLIVKKTVTTAGVVGSIATVIRSVGLASKAFIQDEVIYFLTIYFSDYQPSYFLSDSSGNVIAKLAYSNGGPYLEAGLPSVSYIDGAAMIPYLLKTTIQAANKSQDATNPIGVYSQIGINLATFTIGTSNITTSEIGNNLHLSGGFLWAYDGYLPVEHGFHLWPDDVQAETDADIDLNCDTENGSDIIVVPSTTFLTVGMHVAGTGIPVNTDIIAIIDGTTVQLSEDATADGTGVTLTFTGDVSEQEYFYVAVYEWSDNQGNIFRSAPSVPWSVTTSGSTSINTVYVPTLRLTYKIANPVKITVYRWSEAQQTYYQATSIANPLLNDPENTDYLIFIDIQADSAILGNSILYTTGGVVENIAPNAATAMTIYKSRLWLIDAENPNRLWFSKQVIDGAPVEFSDLFTLYVTPSAGVQGPAGPNTVIFPMDDKLTIYKGSERGIYYITGTGPDNTGANNDFSEPIFIASTLGCDNPKSIVLGPNGTMFQSSTEIWMLGRDLSTSYIGAPVEDFTSEEVTSAVSVAGTNQIRYTLASGTALVYDYFYDQWGTFSNVPAISSTLYEGLHTYISASGRVFQESPGTYLDGSAPVLISFKTGWLNVAGLQGFERAYDFSLLGDFISPHKLFVSIAYDYSGSPEQQTIIEPDNYVGPYGEANPIYGSGGPYGGPGRLEQWRVFFERQKCQAIQIGIQEYFDASFGTAAGAGFTLSGLNVTFGIKGTRPRLPASRQVG